MNKPILIIIAGGTSSGKSTLAKRIEENFKAKGVVNLCAENYIDREGIDLSLLTNPCFEDQCNHHLEFNDPERMKKECLLKNLEDFFRRKEVVEIEVREKDQNGISRWVKKKIKSGDLIILEGVNALQDEEIRNKADLKIFIEADENLRLARKILRSPWCREILGLEIGKDLRNYGNSLSEALKFWNKGTKISENDYVISTKGDAELIINSNNLSEYEEDIEKIFDYVDDLLNKKTLLITKMARKDSKFDKRIMQELSNTLDKLSKQEKIEDQNQEIKKIKNKVESLNGLFNIIKELRENKKSPVRIICDWDEVVKSREATVYYEIIGRSGKFEDFFQRFWENAELKYKGHVGTVVNTHLREVEDLRNKDHSEFEKKAKEEVAVNFNLYDKSPWLSIAGDLLKALKEGLIEKLVFTGNYKENRHTNFEVDKTGGGDLKKIIKFRKSFGKFSNTEFEVNDPFFIEAEKIQLSRAQWINKNYPNFDIFIDDNPENVREVKEIFDSKVIYIMPDYKTNKLLDEDIIRISINTTNLEDKDFFFKIEEKIEVLTK
ncbi:MAG: uridine/cytidine kinase [Mycoplasmataceae bacterium RC_NB112A]|nr:MAG: uridine/cytidine kinase [Mycoplasmataceae bacterium RC_NB112A]KLL02157.1 MAG: uridine/cytidine kinase [Mycoplasmataceae bacterium RC_NB112A]